MAPKSQNKPPVPRTPSTPSNQGKLNTDEVSIDKRRKIGVSKMPSSTVGVRRGRQAFAVVNGNADPPSTSGPPSSAGSDCGVIEFSKEDVEAILAERPELKNKFNIKAKCEQMIEYSKRLRQCIKWFQQLEGAHVTEQESLKSLLESEEKKCNEMHMLMKSKEEGLNATIMELTNRIILLEKNLGKEEIEKAEALGSLCREKDARLAAEKLQVSLSEELTKAQQEYKNAVQQIDSLNYKLKCVEEYNENLKQFSSGLQSEKAATKETLKRLEDEKAALVENLSTLRGHYISLQEQLSSSKAVQDEAIKLKEDLHNLRVAHDNQLSKVKILEQQVAQYKECTAKSSVELDNLTVRSKDLEEIYSSQCEQIRRLQEQLTLAEKKLQVSNMSSMETVSEIEKQRQVIDDLKQRLTEAEEKIVDGEKLRKKLHNTILELKGNIRVFCRVRPALSDDAVTAEKVVSFPTSTEALGRGIDLLHNGQKHSFTFDKVFVPEASQKDVFDEISQLVQSALDGYKVCIFAYGQTGSGKTYTMMGNPGSLDQQGLIPRALDQVFQTRQSHQAQGWKYDMKVSMLEIYNESIRDLLSPNRSSFDNGAKITDIKHDVNGNTHVKDFTIADVCSTKNVSDLLEKAAQSRSIGKTQMNEHSSRSHFVCTLKISGVNESTEQQVHGVLNLIDLAGSERLSKSGAIGDRLRETQAINKSLSSLSDVISALAKKDEHIPFRNSALTYLLQPCLLGDSKTMMFVNVSPDPASTSESLCSLRFAAKVNACEIGVPKRQTSSRISDSRLSFG
ncbi:unnamed protein product [Cuscuta epithymum]|uniref:Kinesin-like protein n=1 Tax=Cuscuta epithymum TaxID=186058 RepID=A0AAV0BVN2_9ASTE|nr:unnamed protein product [Cuscuta epithymum]